MGMGCWVGSWGTSVAIYFFFFFGKHFSINKGLVIFYIRHILINLVTMTVSVYRLFIFKLEKVHCSLHCNVHTW